MCPFSLGTKLICIIKLLDVVSCSINFLCNINNIYSDKNMTSLKTKNIDTCFDQDQTFDQDTMFAIMKLILNPKVFWSHYLFVWFCYLDQSRRWRNAVTSVS